MGINVFPAPSAGGVKSVQRGVATVSGNTTITSVDINKSVVYSFSTGSAGTVAATGTIALTPSGGNTAGRSTSQNGVLIQGDFPSYNGSITGGTTNLTSAQYGAYLTDSTTLTVTGPCRWQVVEFA